MTTAQHSVPQTPPEPLVWPSVTKPPRDIRLFAGHTDTVPDVVGRIGAPLSLVIFTEGNHLMVLLSDEISGAFPPWAKSQPEYADLDLGNVVVVTLPQPVCVQMIRSGGIALGNLTLDVSRKSGFYPDIFMGYPEPLRQLRTLRVLEPQARFFCKNRGLAVLVRKDNPLGIHGLADVARRGARIALPDSGDVRAKCRAAADELLGKPAADAFFAAEVPSFPGRLGIMHRDLPEPLRTRPHSGRRAFFAQIAFGRVSAPLHPRAIKAFDEFFFRRAKDVYPRYDFARMSDDEFGAALGLD